MISVVIAVHNEEDHIVEALTSILKQDVEFECVVVDDGSTDKTPEIIKQMSIENNKIKFIQPGKIGKVNAFNLAVSLAKGEWIALFSGDDIMPENTLAKFLDAGKSFDPINQKVFIGGLQRMFSNDKSLKQFDNVIVPVKSTEGLFSNTLGIVSRALIHITFPVPDNYPNEDGWTMLCYRYLSDIRIQLDQIFINYRIHEGNSLKHNEKYKTYNEKYHARRKVIGEFLDKHQHLLSPEQQYILSELVSMENKRYKGKTISILTMRNIPLIERIKGAVFSNGLLYRLNVIFSNILLRISH